MDVFVYGTLRHAALRGVVLGAEVDGICDQLPAFDVISMDGGLYPGLAKGAGAADGLVLPGLTSGQVARLDHYEGAFGYTLQAQRLASGREAMVYMPPGSLQGDGPFDLARWVSIHGDLAVEAAREVMTYLGTSLDVAPRFGQIKQRAASRLRARGELPMGERQKTTAVKIHGRRMTYSSFFMVEEVRLQVPQYNGGLGPQMMREVFVSGDGALVLPYDPVRDRVMVIEQFRTAPFVRDDPAPWLVEPIAGRIDPLETPADTARREAVEEAGLTLRDLHEIPSGYAAPGGTTDYFYLFCATADLPDSAAGHVGGVAGEAEDILTLLWSFDTLMSNIDGGRVRCTPLVAMAYWLALNRDRLRRG